MKPKQYAEVRVCEVCRRPYRSDRHGATALRCPTCAEKLAPQDETPEPWGDTAECEVCGAVFSFARTRGRAKLCPECRAISLEITRRDAQARWRARQRKATA
jgi:Zn finger protein HypA/HybF involved in hydrogenase expression